MSIRLALLSRLAALGLLLIVLGCGIPQNNPPTSTPVPKREVTATPLPTATPSLKPPLATATPQSSPTPTQPPSTTAVLPEILRGDPEKAQVSLTFDLGGVAGETSRVLSILRQYDLKATFFMTGEFAEKYPDLAQEIANQGHEIANHTYSHPRLTDLSDEEIKTQLQQAEDAIRKVTGRTTRPYMRPPFGARDPRVIKAAAQAGFRSVYWTLDSGDWQEGATAQSVIRRVQDNIGNGYIVIQHAASPITADALPSIISELRARRFTILILSALVGGAPSTSTGEAPSPDPYGLLVPVSKSLSLTSNYLPADLVELTGVPTTRSGMKIRSIVLPHLKKMVEDAKAQGLGLVALSSYRSYQEQETVYNQEVALSGQAQADRTVAKPGHSEHQMGTTVDFTSPSTGYTLSEAFGDAPEGRWLKENAHRYGFVMSYPKGKEAITGYAYEPWHFRYIGIDHASALYQKGITLSEYLLSLP